MPSVTIGNTEYNLQDGNYHLVSTIGLACEIGGVPPGQLTEEELLEYGIHSETGCEIVSNPILIYDNNDKCVLYEDLRHESCTVTFSLNGGGVGSRTPDPQKVPYGGYATPPVPEPTDVEDDFAGWYTDSEIPQQNEYLFNTPVYSSFTLYAKWIVRPDGYLVTFNMMGHGSPTPSSQTIEYGGTVTRPTPDPTDGGYNFNGWYTESSCTHLYNFSDAVYHDMTLYAKWLQKPHTYVVSFDMMGHGTQVPSQTIQPGGTVRKPTDPTATGYVFQAWYKDSACTEGNEYLFNTPVYSSFTLYAKWEEIQTSVIKYSTNNGSIINNTYTATGTTHFGANLVENVVTSISGGIAYCELRFAGAPTIIPNNAFSGCTTLISVDEIPDTVITIGGHAFDSCGNLNGFTFGNGIMFISDYAFNYCRKLQEGSSLTIPDNVIDIGNYAYYSCRGFTSLKLGNNVETIGDYAFASCPMSGLLTIPNNVRRIGNFSFALSNITGLLTIPKNVEYLGTHAFFTCTGLTNLLIYCSMPEIKMLTFDSCTSLTSITFIKVNGNNNIRKIGEAAFARCSNLTSDLVIPDDVNQIDYRAFADVPHITYHGSASGSPWGADAMN